MKTDELIEALAAGIEPVRPARPSPALLLAGAGAAITAVVLLLGVRPDLVVAFQGPAPWLKAGYTLALAGSSLWLLTRLGRPGARARPAVWTLVGIVGIAGLAGLAEVASLPADARMAAWLGLTWRVCPPNILLISAFAAPLTFLAARRLAPTRPMAAGAALGALTGAMAATAYGLHCPEATLAFLATWYTLGVAAAAVLGAVVGRFALRW